jgi:peptidoglycan/LPS O-acetylase OafA/YrhL
MSDRPALPILTSLRFFAAVEVVIFHFFAFKQPDFLHSVLSGGRQAVTFFFVLSGFILTYVYFDQRGEKIAISKTKFWKARFARIIPGYWFGLLVALPPFAYSALISRMSSREDFLQALMLCPLALQAWWPPSAAAWSPPAWSLSVEMVFYFCFPLLAYVAVRMSICQLFATALASVLGAAIVVQIIMPGPDVAALAWKPILYNPAFHLPQFLLGMAFGRLYLIKRPLSGFLHTSLFAVGATIAVLVIGARAILPWWVSSNAVLAPVFGVIIFGAARATGPARALVVTPLIILGDASYSLYVLHWPALFWWSWLQRKVMGTDLPEPVSFAIYFMICIVAAVVTFTLIEKPLRRLILGHRPPTDRPAVASAFEPKPAFHHTLRR